MGKIKTNLSEQNLKTTSISSSGYTSNLPARTKHNILQRKTIKQTFQCIIQNVHYTIKKYIDMQSREIIVNKIGPTDEPDVGFSKQEFNTGYYMHRIFSK